MKYYSNHFSTRKNLRPPELYEYFVDNFWFKSANIENEVINEPLRGSHKADVVILGGGYTGLSAAYNIRKRFPEKKIVLLEGACCGYGASGRNGGFCITYDVLDEAMNKDPKSRQKALNVSSYGLKQIKELVSEYRVDCDLMENGMLEFALNDKQAHSMEKYRDEMKSWGLDAEIIQGKEMEAELKTERFVAAIKFPHGATLNPAKLALGMKKVVEKLGVEIRERTVITRVIPGKVHHIDTELGEIKASEAVLALNAYAPKLGFFKNRIFPICNYVIATEPLSAAQWESIGWNGRQGFGDMRVLFSYVAPTADGRIVIGGADFPYYRNDGISSGNNKSITKLIMKDLFTTFPQLEGLKVDHAWGGTMSGTIGFTPSVGVMGEYKNFYYGLGYFEGVPTAQAAGRMISDLMAGENNEFTNHYIVNHKIPYAGPALMRNIFAPIVKKIMVNFINDRTSIAK